MRKLIFTLILLLAGYIGYMYFFGKEEDRSGARMIVQESRDVIRAVGEFLSHQKEKYDSGEFDRLIDKVEKTIHQLKSTGKEEKDETQKTLRELQTELKKIDPDKLTEEQKQQLRKIQKELDQEFN